MPSTTINSVALYYECHGQGEPLMLIAGFASDSQSWQPIVEGLSRHFLVIIMDNRGTGRTHPQDAETSIQHMADDCIALMNKLALPSVTLLGHSMGGFVALDCTIRYPERVSRLILAGTSALSLQRNHVLFDDWVSYLKSTMERDTWFRNVFYWIFSRAFFENRETVDVAIQATLEYPYPQGKLAFEKQVQAIKVFDCRRKISEIKQHVLIICGKEDLLFPPPESIEVLQAIPATSVVIIAGAAHSIHMEKPLEFTDCVVGFMKEG